MSLSMPTPDSQSASDMTSARKAPTTLEGKALVSRSRRLTLHFRQIVMAVVAMSHAEQ